MEETVLKATHRTLIGKQVSQLRRQGQLPAVLYGVGLEPTPIALDHRETARILSHTAASTLITLDLEGKRHKVLIRERQRTPVGGVLRHLDFHAVSMVQKLKIDVPVVLTGEAPAVAEHEGILFQSTETVTVECLPGDIPENLTADLSELKEIGDAIYVRDLEVPDNVTLISNPDDVIANVTFQAAEEIEEVVVEEVVEETEPELVERGKRDEDEEAAEAEE
jgi:large subunit ribosomal protein L25